MGASFSQWSFRTKQYENFIRLAESSATCLSIFLYTWSSKSACIFLSQRNLLRASGAHKELLLTLILMTRGEICMILLIDTFVYSIGVGILIRNHSHHLHIPSSSPQLSKSCQTCNAPQQTHPKVSSKSLFQTPMQCKGCPCCIDNHLLPPL